LGLGRVELEDGEQVTGFLCESVAAATATDVTHYGGWRSYLAASAPVVPA
jgi:allophanate hydrolase